MTNGSNKLPEVKISVSWPGFVALVNLIGQQFQFIPNAAFVVCVLSVEFRGISTKKKSAKICNKCYTKILNAPKR